MTPGRHGSGVNVGGSASGQQLTPVDLRHERQRAVEPRGRIITDLSSNSSPSYFNFDSFEQIQVVTGGGDVSVQSSGLSINLVTKSGINVFKGTALMTFENDKMQWQNVTEELFNASEGGFLSGNPIQRIGNYSVGVRRPDQAEPALVLGRGRLSGHQRRRRPTSSTPRRAPSVSSSSTRSGSATVAGRLRPDRGRAGLSAERQDDDQGPVVEVQLPAERGQQVPVPVPERQQVPEPPRRQREHARRRGDAADLRHAEVDRLLGPAAADALR